MAAPSLTMTLRIPTKGAAVVVAPRRRRCGQLAVARASAEHQEVAAAAGTNGDDGSAYASSGRRGAVLAVAGAVATAAAVGRSAARAASNLEVGAWEPIKNVDDRYIQDLGRWAVSEHSGRMRFAKVVGGCQQVVAGMNYNLDIETTDRGQKYVAALYVPPGAREGSRKLTNFVGPFDME